MQLTVTLHKYFISLYQKQRFNSELQNVLLQVLCTYSSLPLPPPRVYIYLLEMSHLLTQNNAVAQIQGNCHPCSYTESQAVINARIRIWVLQRWCAVNNLGPEEGTTKHFRHLTFFFFWHLLCHLPPPSKLLCGVCGVVRAYNEGSIYAG